MTQIETQLRLLLLETQTGSHIAATKLYFFKVPQKTVRCFVLSDSYCISSFCLIRSFIPPQYSVPLVLYHLVEKEGNSLAQAEIAALG